jgi:hypothetical protein
MCIRHGSWFQQSNLNFIEVLFLTYIVRSNEHDREHVAACEGLTQSLQPVRGFTVYQLAQSAAECRSDNVVRFTKFIGIVASRSCHYVTRRRRTPHFGPVTAHKCQLVACTLPRMTWHVHSWCYARHMQLKF